ncbi:DUF6207 family protein [Streptomyces sp. NPDC087219]|uniref:DUF6207 family protein n=1 Tax=Streptomyces sp. NPDC087219 TaxID=3365770 RepID=UPI0037F99D46
MEPIGPIHVSEPGLIVLDLTATDEATLQAAVEEPAGCWATSDTAGGAGPQRAGCERTALYADLRC